MNEDEGNERLIQLLEAQHVFPGLYPIAIIAKSWDEITAGIRAAVNAELDVPLGDSDFVVTVSGGGRFRSHRVEAPCADAHAVLRLYVRLRAIDGVITVL